MSDEKGSRCESCTNSSPYFASRGMIHWETGKERYGKDSEARRPALHEECIGYERWPGANGSAFLSEKGERPAF
mgnify:CR=1 FL=1